MLNTLRIKSLWGAPVKGVLAAILLAGSGAPMAAAVTVDLCATTGTAALPPAATAPVFGYALGLCPATVTAPGGPVIAVTQGDVVTVNLHNSIPEASGLLLQGQSMPTDTAGIASGGTKSYTFTASNAGTFLYQAAPLANAEHQVAMGLYGALVVKPVALPPVPASTSGSSTAADPAGLTLTNSGAAFTSAMVGGTLSNTTDLSSCTITGFTATTLSCPAQLAGGTLNTWTIGDGYSVAYTTPAALQAYASPASAYDDESVLVLSELDPALNGNTTPKTFDMRNFAPKYFLINGKAYPQTAAIPSVAGHKVLLRYVNAGAKHHSMAVLGLRQSFIAKDGSAFAQTPATVTAETLAPGQTGDAIATIPAAATTDSKFALYDGNLLLHNNGAAGFGGMMTFLTAGTGSGATGPVTSSVALAPSKTDGSAPVALTASISSTASTIAAAEYFIDAPGANGTGSAMSGAFAGATEAVNASISTAALGLLASGNHTFYVHGQDALSAWGALSSVVLNLDKAGPTSSAMALAPNPSKLGQAVALSATANDSASGGSNVTAAMYGIDLVGPALPAVPMTLAGAAGPVRSITATISGGLPVGAHTVSVRSQDSLGNWGAVAKIVLNVTTGGPGTSLVTVNPAANNGANPLSSSQPVVRVSATMTKTGGTVKGAEGFIDTVTADGTGFPFVPTDGVWNGATEKGTGDIPLSVINALANGNHTICVHGKDGTGVWGATTCTNMLMDRAAPTLSSFTIASSTVAYGTNVTLTLTANDPLVGVPALASGVSGGQYWIDGSATPPATSNLFTGTSPAAPTSVIGGGNHTIYVRVRDVAGNWSGVLSRTVTVVRATPDTRTFTVNNNAAGNSATQTFNTTSAQGVLANDLPTGGTVVIASALVRTGGAGTATGTVNCSATPTPALGTPAAPAISGQTLCTNGAYRVTLTAPASATTNAQRRAAKRGTYQFTYTYTVSGVPSTGTVTITVN